MIFRDFFSSRNDNERKVHSGHVVCAIYIYIYIYIYIQEKLTKNRQKRFIVYTISQSLNTLSPHTYIYVNIYMENHLISIQKIIFYTNEKYKNYIIVNVEAYQPNEEPYVELYKGALVVKKKWNSLKKVFLLNKRKPTNANVQKLAQ